MKKQKNTEKGFYLIWSREQLIKELCRINQLLLDSSKLLGKISYKIK